ncbi:MmcQ/YjbR family DNA-binding protein [Cohnella faecalis]|uniref:MmcQ/YjbR family DNA-binding protein n=1 Tax=Cohnella faecalis TaxID=2315694 RepID=A0A398CJ89_9BACL|nr:MmcQ/YjbR family DNA-binding protein [Cohnella faecalis]RIE03376.1 MmcQ/YjbR family DNA-binding protein [Cohnella faecalis]
MISVDEIRSYVLTLPETVEVEHWGKPSFRIKNKIFVVLQEDGRTLTVKTIGDDRAIYTELDPTTYRIPDAYAKLSYMHMNINQVEPEEARGLIYKAWSSVAPKRLVNRKPGTMS